MAAKALVTISVSSNLSSLPRLSSFKRFPLHNLPKPTRVFVGFRPLCTITTATAPSPDIESDQALQPSKQSILLERLRVRHLKYSAKPPAQGKTDLQSDGLVREKNAHEFQKPQKKKKHLVESFEELGLSEEVMGAVKEVNIEVPTEIQCLGIPAVLGGKSVVLGSHTGSGKTLAYMLPLVQVTFSSIVFFILFFLNELFTEDIDYIFFSCGSL